MSRETYIIIRAGNDGRCHLFSCMALHFGETISIASRHIIIVPSNNTCRNKLMNLFCSNLLLICVGHSPAFSIDLEHLSSSDNNQRKMCTLHQLLLGRLKSEIRVGLSAGHEWD